MLLLAEPRRIRRIRSLGHSLHRLTYRRTNRGRFARAALLGAFEEKTESQFLCLLILLPHILPSDHITKDNLLAHLTTSCQNLRFPDKNHNRQRGLTP
jgi:hypothetical protein